MMWGHGKKRGLRNWLMMILRRGPKNGAQLMDEMELMTRGWWRPSPGSVYPLLEEMVSEGVLKRRADGTYELSEVGAKDPTWSWFQSPRSVKEVANELSGLTSYLEDLARNDPAALSEVATEIGSVARRLEHLGR
jgi:DNA-binding PadR family transcriptional regulator